MKNTHENLTLICDSYKIAHPRLLHPNVEYVQSYFEARMALKPIRFFGLQYYIKRYLLNRVTVEDVEEAREFYAAHFGRPDVFDYDGWMYIAKELGGKLPIRIYAVPEGMIAQGRTPLFVVESTKKGRKVPWIVGHVETLLSQVWYPTTVATNSWECKRFLSSMLDATSDLPDNVKTLVLMTRLHDFGYRGVSTPEEAGIGGLAHLTNFAGTDTLRAIQFAKWYYNETGMPGISIPATEHFVMTHRGRDVFGEQESMEKLLDTYKDGFIACVSDSYDLMRAVTKIWGDTLKDKVLARNGTLVIRPDSGDPVVTTEKVFEALWKAFGGTVNSKGFRVLDSHVRMIQGDGINQDMLRKIVLNFADKKIALENIAFGSGGGLLRKFDRDTFKFAFKCNMVVIDGQEVEVKKSPMEWDRDERYVKSFKHSKSGDLRGNLPSVYEDGELLKDFTLDEVRANGDKHFEWVK